MVKVFFAACFQSPGVKGFGKNFDHACLNRKRKRRPERADALTTLALEDISLFTPNEFDGFDDRRHF